jgi:predicted nucleic acid-binding protein
VTKPIFVDTLFVVALINRRDQYHQQAVAVSRQIEGRPLLVTDTVLLEIGNALARNFRTEAAQIIEQFLAADEVEVVRLTPQLFEEAFQLYRIHQDKTWGLIDCISFSVMKTAGATQALTFDRHFVQAGYKVLMREDAVS